MADTIVYEQVIEVLLSGFTESIINQPPSLAVFEQVIEVLIPFEGSSQVYINELE